MNRLTIRLRPELATLIAAFGGDHAATARALIVIGAAALGHPLPHEARRTITERLDDTLVTALWALAATWQPPDRRLAAAGQPPDRHLAATPEDRVPLDSPPTEADALDDDHTLTDADIFTAMGMEV